MNFFDLKEQVKTLCALEGYADISPPPDWGAAVNRALKIVSWEGEYNVRELSVTTAASQAVYTLTPPDWKAITDVYYDTASGAPRPLSASSDTQERVYNPNWRFEPAGAPLVYWLEEPNRLRLHPAPADGGVQVLVIGICAEPDLTNDTDVPLCPERYHDDVCRLAAWTVAQSYATGEARARAATYRLEAIDNISRLKVDRFNQRRATNFRSMRSSPRRRIIL